MPYDRLVILTPHVEVPIFTEGIVGLSARYLLDFPVFESVHTHELVRLLDELTEAQLAAMVQSTAIDHPLITQDVNVVLSAPDLLNSDARGKFDPGWLSNVLLF